MDDTSIATNTCRLRTQILAATQMLLAVAMFCATCVASATLRAQEMLPTSAYDAQAWGACDDPRSGGVLAESYAYHRQGAQPQSIAPPGGAYRYGFPVPSYRWGWFGARHYNPYVVWHRGYNGDCVRWAYRSGY